MDIDTIKILRDPYTFEDLTTKDNCIVNTYNRNTYGIEKNIVRFMEDDEITGNNKKYLEFYNKIAPFYNFANKLYFIFKFGSEENYRKEFLSELEIKDKDKVIEISVGTADNFPFLPKNIDLYGLDISLGMLKQAKKHLNKWNINAQLFQGAAESLPFKDGSFDVVYHVGGINYFNHKDKAINEMIRIAKSGTKIVIVDETEKLVNGTYKKTPITKKYYDEEYDISAPIELIPKEMLDINYREVCKGLMYCLSFRKPY
ncbi:class I SAM-dependent methyltransferase [Tissierella sp. MB52-C2]|uniref:class I SAM-dependent methyltransferase n=1 Tax=Tissierella sp. MB52-C2 TaxID=3070999 RepID=UPI00280ACB00|nr:methyltransferase domain-containing protein [Tissierella sp. MB52-C2]WMM23474.1 class I SAM-dependent methyltransferase [Tissierella sp. MB52-C2]